MYQTDCLHCEAFSIPSSLQSYWEGRSVAVLDLETTGLSAKRDHLILVGLLTREENGLRARQFFAETPQQERAVLSALSNLIPHFSVLITYNGNQFDLPFLIRRMGYASDFEFEPAIQSLCAASSFDLYSVLRKFSSLGKTLPNLKQKTVEDYMGISALRTDAISGAESAMQYAQYVSSPQEGLREQILLHNGDDILQLARLLPVLNGLDIHRIMGETGFPLPKHSCTGKVSSVRLSRKDLHIHVTGTLASLTADCRSFQPGYQFSFCAHTGKFSLTLPLQQEQGYGFADLEGLNRDLPSQVWKEFQTDPLYESGYLILSSPEGLQYPQANHLAEKILTEIIIRFAQNVLQ